MSGDPNCIPKGYGNLIKYGYRTQKRQSNRYRGLSRSVNAYGYGSVQQQITKKYQCYKKDPSKRSLKILYAKQHKWLRKKYL